MSYAFNFKKSILTNQPFSFVQYKYKTFFSFRIVTVVQYVRKKCVETKETQYTSPITYKNARGKHLQSARAVLSATGMIISCLNWFFKFQNVQLLYLWLLLGIHFSVKKLGRITNTTYILSCGYETKLPIKIIVHLFRTYTFDSDWSYLQLNDYNWQANRNSQQTTKKRKNASIPLFLCSLKTLSLYEMTDLW